MFFQTLSHTLHRKRFNNFSGVLPEFPCAHMFCTQIHTLLKNTLTLRSILFILSCALHFASYTYLYNYIHSILFNRCIIGTYHNLSIKPLLTEFQWFSFVVVCHQKLWHREHPCTCIFANTCKYNYRKKIEVGLITGSILCLLIFINFTKLTPKMCINLYANQKDARVPDLHNFTKFLYYQI